MKKVLYIVIAIAVIGLAYFLLNSNKEKNQSESDLVAQKNTSVAVRIDTVTTEVPNLDYVANGTFAPAQELSFPAENSGRVVKVLVDEGSPVRIGQTLAIIKGDQLSIEVQNANAAYQNALTDSQRYENAFKTGGVTKQQLDQAKLNLVNAKARLDQAKISYGDATIKSSINGIVNKRNIEPGSVVSPGTVLFELVNVSTLKLKTTVDENHVATLKVGNPVKVTASVFPDKEFKGKVSFTSSKGDASLRYEVEISLDGETKDIKPGMYGYAAFNYDKEEAILINRRALVSGLKNPQVFVVEDGKAKLKPIKISSIGQDQLVLLDGLKEGEKLITTGLINLQDGTAISEL